MSPVRHPVGSLYVWPGCTFTGYSGGNYDGEAREYLGEYQAYDFTGGSVYGGSSCPGGYAQHNVNLYLLSRTHMLISQLRFIQMPVHPGDV